MKLTLFRRLALVATLVALAVSAVVDVTTLVAACHALMSAALEGELAALEAGGAIAVEGVELRLADVLLARTPRIAATTGTCA